MEAIKNLLKYKLQDEYQYETIRGTERCLFTYSAFNTYPETLRVAVPDLMQLVKDIDMMDARLPPAEIWEVNKLYCAEKDREDDLDDDLYVFVMLGSDEIGLVKLKLCEVIK